MLTDAADYQFFTYISDLLYPVTRVTRYPLVRLTVSSYHRPTCVVCDYHALLNVMIDQLLLNI